MAEVSRRDFLKLIRDGFLYLSGGLVVGGLIRFLDSEANPTPKTVFDLGASSRYPLNSRTVISEPPAVVIHNETGFSALSLVCTHLGCTVESNSQGFACPCHGSHFDGNGNVIQGPAKRPLQSLRVQITEEGNLKLFTE